MKFYSISRKISAYRVTFGYLRCDFYAGVQFLLSFHCFPALFASTTKRAIQIETRSGYCTDLDSFLDFLRDLTMASCAVRLLLAGILTGAICQGKERDWDGFSAFFYAGRGGGALSQF